MGWIDIVVALCLNRHASFRNKAISKLDKEGDNSLSELNGWWLIIKQTLNSKWGNYINALNKISEKLVLYYIKEKKILWTLMLIVYEELILTNYLLVVGYLVDNGSWSICKIRLVLVLNCTLCKGHF